MKCRYCNQEHPDGFQFCPTTGKKLEALKACMLNPACPDHGKHILPLDSLYCPTCGFKLENADIYNVEENHHIYSSSSPSFENETIKNLIKKREPAQIISALMSAAHLQ